MNTFLSSHNHNNNYDGLKLGNYIRINDGTYNKDWEIAGFDCEHNRLAADGTVYDNGYGICLIPKTFLVGSDMKWNDTQTLTGGYMASTMHTSNLVTVANNLKNVLGSHLVLRNVLLSSGVSSGGTTNSNAYTWTTSYCTLMSMGQLTGTFKQNRNRYDDGEANYKLPLFNYENYYTGYSFYLRAIYSSGYAYSIRKMDETTYYVNVTYGDAVRPLIYIR